MSQLDGGARPSTLIARLDHGLEFALYYASAALIIALTAVIFYAVAARYLFNAAPGWSEEIPRVIFLWVSYLAIAVAVKRGQNLRVTFIIERFAPAWRLAIELVMHACVFVMLIVLIRYNQPVIDLNSMTKMLASQWSDAVRYWPLSIGCALMALYQVRMVLASIEQYRRGRS